MRVNLGQVGGDRQITGVDVRKRSPKRTEESQNEIEALEHHGKANHPGMCIEREVERQCRMMTLAEASEPGQQRVQSAFKVLPYLAVQPGTRRLRQRCDRLRLRTSTPPIDLFIGQLLAGNAEIIARCGGMGERSGVDASQLSKDVHFRPHTGGHR